MRKRMKDALCKVGFHNWERVSFVSPQYGRTERLCSNCGKRQYGTIEGKDIKWIDV